jgi:hypothetical protein|tara:strand:+ start:929 stop:1312 length:384 start_codon:yes stop_codon:yes gene_type:complete
MEYVELLGGTGGGATASKGFDPTSLITSLVTTGIGIAFQKSDAKKQRELEKALAKMSLDSQEAIAKKYADAQTNIEKQRIIFQILAIEKNEALIKGLEKDKYKSIVLVSVSTLVLAVVIFMAKKRKK